MPERYISSLIIFLMNQIISFPINTALYFKGSFEDFPWHNNQGHKREILLIVLVILSHSHNNLLVDHEVKSLGPLFGPSI